jgi:signal transduction histidine kinase/DNA-binding NarL/FixJ family response regulator
MKERQFSVLIAAAAPEARAAIHDALSRDPVISYVAIDAESGLRALELRSAQRPDCLILDHDLPDLSTLEALKKLAAEERVPACAVVVLVGAGDVRLATEAIESGAHCCLEKNRARGEELLHAVSQAIEKAERQRRFAEREQLTRELAARAKAAQTEEKIRRLQAVIDVALAHHTLDDLLHEMLVSIRELLETDYDAILLLTEDQQSLVVSSTIGLDEAIGIRIPVGRGVAGSIAASRAPLIVEDLSAVEVINPVLRRMVHSLVGAPLIAEGRLIGVIHADTARDKRFTEDDVRLLQLAADRIALAIEQRRLYEVERQARRQAEEANRSKDEFLSVVSHELRTPLNAILGYARLLRRGPQDPQWVERAAEVIERSGMAQLRLIDDLLDTASIISGKLRLETGPVDLASVIEEAVQTLRPAADAKGVSLQAKLSPEVGQITGDPLRLRQVVWNLISNAVKFTPQGGRVGVRLERIDPHICITVSDTGKGIKAEFLPCIFDRFRQADASITRRHGGLGLGLSLVKYLVELHGGTIEAASEGEGRGATFKILVPVS